MSKGDVTSMLGCSGTQAVLESAQLQEHEPAAAARGCGKLATCQALLRLGTLRNWLTGCTKHLQGIGIGSSPGPGAGFLWPLKPSSKVVLPTAASMLVNRSLRDLVLSPQSLWPAVPSLEEHCRTLPQIQKHATCLT